MRGRFPNGYNPKAFTVWYDRWKGRGWMWRERKNSPHRVDPETDVMEADGYDSRVHAQAGIRAELRERENRLASSELRAAN